jgi:hypothetical protein
MFTMIGFRPDIAYDMNIILRFCKDRKKIHCVDVKQIIKYFNGTLNHSNFYSHGHGVNILTIYTHVGYVGDLMTIDLTMVVC